MVLCPWLSQRLPSSKKPPWPPGGFLLSDPPVTPLPTAALPPCPCPPPPAPDARQTAWPRRWQRLTQLHWSRLRPEHVHPNPPPPPWPAAPARARHAAPAHLPPSPPAPPRPPRPPHAPANPHRKARPSSLCWTPTCSCMTQPASSALKSTTSSCR